MAKPTQGKFYAADIDDYVAGIQEAMTCIAGAMNAIKGIRDFDCWFVALGELYDEMQPDCKHYEELSSEEYEAEIAALTADYYRSVL